MEGISEEAERRDINSTKLLEKALKKADVLQKEISAGGISKRQQALLAESYLAQGEEAKRTRENIIEDLKGKMVRDRKELAYKVNTQIQDLNKQRAELIKKEESICLRRATIAKMEERGYDFMAEIEMGNAPPMDYIMRNLGVDREQNP